MAALGVFRREPDDSFRVPLGVALKGIDAQALADSYIRREGDQAFVVARRDGARPEVLRLIRGALRRKRGAR